MLQQVLDVLWYCGPAVSCTLLYPSRLVCTHLEPIKD